MLLVCCNEFERRSVVCTHIDKLLLLALVVSAAGLVLEDNVVVPAPLNSEIGLVQQRVSSSNVPLALLGLGRFFFAFLSLSLFCTLALDLFQLALQLGRLVFVVTVVVAAVVIVVILIIILIVVVFVVIVILV